MGFRDEVSALIASRPGPSCSIALLKSAMSPEDADELEECLADPTVPDSMVAKVLHQRGVEVRVNTLARHRRRQCSCPRPEAPPA